MSQATRSIRRRGSGARLLQLLREAKPDIKRVGILWTYVIPAFPKEEIEPGYAELNSAARSLNLELHIVEVANSDQVQAALAEIDEWKPGGLLLTSLFSEKAKSVVMQFAVDKGLPTIVDFDWTRSAPAPSPSVLRTHISRACADCGRFSRQNFAGF